MSGTRVWVFIPNNEAPRVEVYSHERAAMAALREWYCDEIAVLIEDGVIAESACDRVIADALSDNGESFLCDEREVRH